MLASLAKEHSRIAADIEHFTEQWSTRLRTLPDSQSISTSAEAKQRLTIVPPLADGQFDDSLGIPIHCIAQNVSYKWSNLDRN